MSYHFLLASWGTLGNLSPLLTAGRLLRQKGHHVRVMADPAMRAEIEAADFEFVTWRRAPTGEAADPTDFSDIRDWMRRALFVPAATYAADIQDEIGRMPTDAILSLDILFGAALGAEASDVPFAFLSPHVSIRTLPGMPPATSGLGQPKTPQDRAEVAAASAGLAAAMNASLHILNRARVELGLPALADIMDLFDRADRLLLATSQAFDFQADSLPDNFRYVGPLLDVPNWSKSLQAKSLQAKSWQAPWPAQPHDLVMKEVSVVISQGGHGTVTRSLVNGLPQLILPMARDQAGNAARVVAKGAGLLLPPAASEAEIAATINRLITDPQFKAAARRVGDAIKADIDRSGLVEEMEMIAAAGRAARQQPLRGQLQGTA